MHIYLLDDNRELVATMMPLLLAVGYQAHGFTDANEFFDTVVTLPQDILVLDIRMPGLNGINVLNALAQTSAPPKIILMSGSDQSILNSTAAFARDLGLSVVSTLTKPFNYKALITIIKSVDNRASSFVPTREKVISGEEIRNAIRGNELSLYFQPQVIISSGLVYGYEALARWNHSNFGLLTASEFMPTVDKHGLVDELSFWMLPEAARQARGIQQKQKNVAISVNISAKTLTQVRFIETIKEMLSTYIDPQSLTVELVETDFIDNFKETLDSLLQLRLLGVKLSVDDFGTGYSSLSLLHKLPFSELKIDKSFVLNLMSDQDSKNIVKSCIMLGHQLNMEVVAEGVDSQEIYDFLRFERCSKAQGYFISEPIEGKAINDWASDYSSQLLGIDA